MERESHPIPFLNRLTVRLTAGVILVLLVIGAPFMLAFHRLLRAQQFRALAEATDGLSRVVVDSLRGAMLAEQPHLSDEVIFGLADQPEVERVMLVDHDGRVSISTDPTYAGRRLDRLQEAMCTVCHRAGRDPPRSRSTVTRDGTDRVLRAMTTIPNEEACHRCHDPAVAVNGILLMDLALQATDRRFFSDIGATLALGTLMVVLTIAVLVLLLQRMIHGPLQALMATSFKVVDGDLDARATVSVGEFGQLASQLNRMTDHLARSIRTHKNQRRELQAILDAIDDEVVVLDPDLRIVTANAAFERSVACGDAVGRPCHEATAAQWPCNPDQPGGCPVRQVFDTGCVNKGLITRSDPDGTERALEIHASPLRGPHGEVTHAVEVRRDISERRQLEAVLAHSEHLASLGLLASGLSHEINNPLGAIATSVAGLRRRLAESPPGEGTDGLEQSLARIAHEVQRGRTITHRLLRIARPPGSSRSLVDVNHIVEEILALLAHDIRQAGIRTRLELGADLPLLAGGESRVGQIVMNLTLNAIQAMIDKGGELRITTAASNGSLRIEIEDDGCGIPAPIRKRIYEPFFTTKPVGKGTGLGLFITHRLVKEMGGTVAVRSEPRQGASFTVQLPLNQRTNRA